MSLRISDARLAGLLYFLLVVTGIFNLLYVPSRTIVRGDPAATLDAISGEPMLFAAGICAGLASYVIYLALPVVLFGVLKPYGAVLARLMVLFTAVSIPISFMAVSEKLEVLELVQGASPDELAALAGPVMEHLGRYSSLITLSSIFWGLWLIPLGILCWRSRLVPWLLSILLLLGGLSFLIEFAVPLFWTGFSGSLVETIVGTPSSLGEIGTCLWLLLAPRHRLRSPATAQAG